MCDIRDCGNLLSRICSKPLALQGLSSITGTGLALQETPVDPSGCQLLQFIKRIFCEMPQFSVWPLSSPARCSWKLLVGALSCQVLRNPSCGRDCTFSKKTQCSLPQSGSFPEELAITGGGAGPASRTQCLGHFGSSWPRQPHDQPWKLPQGH